MKLKQHINNSNWLADVARDLLPTTVAVAEMDPRMDCIGLHPDEAPAMITMAPARRREYTAGRIAAHEAMGQVSTTQEPVIRGQDRSPIWPAGIVGSISHSKKHSIAAVASADDVQSLGVVLEPDVELEPYMYREVCSPEEMKWLEQQPFDRRGNLAKLIFCAKGCTYKCQLPLTRRLLWYNSLQIQIDQSTTSFSATFSQSAGTFCSGDRLTGRFFVGQGVILTTLII